ncbi:hypothetical protein [Halococcus thailandensis]|uniref:Uncharacterized protein n=1 Tax=Halococcus thailandensis JCM 13552 TaxID=1227457 RepID=M0N7L3_9EURY|nr:hypothetical protein [Halococcus thailandensis]EMA53932.1 hypothetical protein C451_08228 [Halococcus thailandensis JCM 13552]
MKLRGYIEVAILVVVMWFVFQDIVQPILIGIDPMFADQSVDRVRRGPQTPAQVAGIVTYAVGAFIYYSGKLMYSHSILVYFLGFQRVILMIIPNTILPEKYHPRKMETVEELAEQYKD